MTMTVLMIITVMLQMLLSMMALTKTMTMTIFFLVDTAHIQIPSIHSSARLPLPPSRVQPLFLKQKYASSAPNRHSRYKCADKTPP